MKRTTYILIGLLLAGLIVMIAIIVVMAEKGEMMERTGMSMDGERLSKKLDGVRVVKVFASLEEESEFEYTVIGAIGVTSASAVGEECISFPKNEYLRVTQVNDTLLVELDFKTNAIPEKYKWRGMLLLKGLNLQLTVDSTLKQIVNELDYVELNLKKMKSDSLSVRLAYQSILLDSCQFRSFDIAGRGSRFLAKESEIDNFYMNLDDISNWTFENSKVGTEFLSGSESHYNTLQKGECDRVVWTPKTEKAELHISFKEKAVITIPK